MLSQSTGAPITQSHGMISDILEELRLQELHIILRKTTVSRMWCNIVSWLVTGCYTGTGSWHCEKLSCIYKNKSFTVPELCNLWSS